MNIWTSLTGRAPEVRLGKKDSLRSSSCTMDPSKGCPTRKSDFWYVWTCSRIEWEMAVLWNTGDEKKKQRVDNGSRTELANRSISFCRSF